MPTDDTPTITVGIDADIGAFQEKLELATRLGGQLGKSLTTAFEGIALRGKSLADVLRQLSLSLSQMVLRSAFKPLEQALSNAFTGLFAGAFGFARGGVIRQGLPIPFAHGGVIASPTRFPLAGGRTGLLGERGPEAILPLARGPDGRLGIASAGSPAINVTLNVTTPDIDSFRRSETQLAALLARTVSLGQRNL